MEDLFLTPDQHKLLIANKTDIESQFNVQIYVPAIVHSECFSRDVIFASIRGRKENIENVKNSLQKFMKKENDDSVLIEEGNANLIDIPVITISDDDDEQSSNVLTDTQNKRLKRKIKNKKKKKKPRVLARVDLSSSGADENICEVSSTTEDLDSKKSNPECSVPACDFIPLNPKSAQKMQEKGSVSVSDDEIMVLEDPPIERPIPKDPKLLRPVVIDGSNVAREHGKVQNTFSCKGIQLSVEFFLKRGHAQVTAFVPNYRRHHHFGHVKTTDHQILEELAKSQHVVFTPSRRVQGKRVTCYDDRFTVELASQTGGVILSNDNYKDLIDVSDAFKKTIEERLLMFCFVGDILMIPNDPLGRKGPSLDEFLSLPSPE